MSELGVGDMVMRTCENSDVGCFGAKEMVKGSWACYECGVSLTSPNDFVNYHEQPFFEAGACRDGGILKAVFEGTEYGEPYDFEFSKVNMGIEVATLCDMDDARVAVRAWEAFDAFAGVDFEAEVVDLGVVDVALYGRLSYRIYPHALAWRLLNAVKDAVTTRRTLVAAVLGSDKAA